MNNFAEFNAIYADYFKGCICPTRECLAVKALPKNASIEIVAEAGM